MSITRLPAIPLIVNDPYFSIWSACDLPTSRPTTHWAGEEKPVNAYVIVDGVARGILGSSGRVPMTLVASNVTATATEFVYEDLGVRAKLRFTTPLLMNDPDVLSANVTYGEITTESIDGQAHDISVAFSASAALTYSGVEAKPCISDKFNVKGLNLAFVGQATQKPLSHSGDHITIDWGYLYLASHDEVDHSANGVSVSGKDNVAFMIGYDDTAAINYFGKLTPAWYARNGKNMVEMLVEMDVRRGEILNLCARLDKEIYEKSVAIGGEDYAAITAASYRHCIAAHKLIADENGEMVFLSKENDSNGCIGTVDVSYPSIPLMLIYNPELVRALCRQILKFANLPVWKYDFAPHDVGRYPNATGQVYAANRRREVSNGMTHPPYYLYPASAECYDFRYQMPVEECGNMLIMLAAAWYADGDAKLAGKYMPTLDKWVRYLIEYGEDPGNQLCTDDFAGHLARNINLSAKAVCGVAAYGMLVKAMGDAEKGEEYIKKAYDMAQNWYQRADAGDHTWLTFDGLGWSMKYNMIWDKLFKLDMLPEKFYANENEWYKKSMNEYGLPLDSRCSYTKSDWFMWVAAMAPIEDMPDYAGPLAKYLRESSSRVAFSDWYDTKSGCYQAFIARSVQGGVFMPMLAQKWKDK